MNLNFSVFYDQSLLLLKLKFFLKKQAFIKKNQRFQKYSKTNKEKTIKNFLSKIINQSIFKKVNKRNVF
jgi:hypothetical protein